MFDNTYFQILPNEIVDLIFAISKIDIIIKLQEIIRNFLSKTKILQIQNLIMFAEKSNLGLDMNIFNIFYFNRILSKKEVISILSKCNCCETHQKNRPKTLVFWKVDTTTPLSNNKCKECKCQCRHISRFICRGIS